jgi:hypothetical protein
MISKVGPSAGPSVDLIQTAGAINPISVASLHDFTVIVRFVGRSFVTPGEAGTAVV